MKLLFDLDGTLWKTNNSYIYSYNKIMDLNNIKNRKSDEEVLSFLGVKLNELVYGLFPEFNDKEKIGIEAMTYSIEYILTHKEESTFLNIKDILTRLSKAYDLYIVSNCPKAYVNAFIETIDIKDLKISYYTIEDGSKIDNINNIIGDSKAIFVGDSNEDYESISNHYNVSFIYAKYGYIKALEYDYSINDINELESVLEAIKIKARMLKNKEYKVISYNDSNLTLIKNNDGSYYFGFVNFNNNSDDLKVIEKLKAEMDKIDKKVIGPINSNTFYPYRFTYDNFDLKLYPDCKNTKETLDLFLNNGFSISDMYVSTLSSIHEKLYKESLKDKYNKFNVKVITDGNFSDYIEDIYEVVIDSFKSAKYYEEITLEDFKEIYIKNINLVKPDLVLVFDDTKLIGFNFSYDDFEKRFYVSKTCGIRKEYQNSACLMLIVRYAFKLMMDKGYNEVLYHYQNMETRPLKAIYRNHTLKEKRYCLVKYEK